VDIVEYRFTWKLLKETGLAPSLQYCVKCGCRLDAGATWTNDGLICFSCSESKKNAVTAEDLKSIRAAALLNHEKFIEWSKLEQKTALYKDELNKLVTFFTDWD
jgi:recombinational DNA repair protein (RecF pathway)